MKSSILFFLILTSTVCFARQGSNGHTPALENVRVEVKRPGRSNGQFVATVQPMAFIVFEYASCGEKNFKLKNVRHNGAMGAEVVALKLKNKRDCRSKKVKRTYRVQVSSDYQDEQYIVQNPVPVISRRPVRRQSGHRPGLRRRGL